MSPYLHAHFAIHLPQGGPNIGFTSLLLTDVTQELHGRIPGLHLKLWLLVLRGGFAGADLFGPIALQ